MHANAQSQSHQAGLPTSAHSHVSNSERFPHHSDNRCAHSLTHPHLSHPPACARPHRCRSLSLSLSDHDDIANRGVLIQARRRYRNICHAPTRPIANTTYTHRPTDRQFARSLHRTAHGRANPVFTNRVARRVPTIDRFRTIDAPRPLNSRNNGGPTPPPVHVNHPASGLPVPLH